jgi:1-deoxy-D-xylulose-5-phosphate reductoisomerase
MPELAAQVRQFQPACVGVPDAQKAAELREALGGDHDDLDVRVGPQGLAAIASAPEVDAVMAAIVGAAGLPACIAAARAGKRLMLANKEALVVGGGLFMQAVREGGATLLPIDSEHSAIFQCLPEDRGAWADRIDHIILTASGGPFRERDPETLHAVTPDQAVAHPNWVMGRKISVDSATMMNKALEVIEARWLFDLTPDRIRVVIHPQSIIHSMVVCRDGSVLAQLGTPDMRVPIAYGLSFPHRIESGAPRLDFHALKGLTFEEPDHRRFPGLRLAFDALEGPEGACAVLNAANEVSVDAFLQGRIAFTAIHEVNRRSVEALAGRWTAPSGMEDLLDLDRRGREEAAGHVNRLVR